MHILQYYIVPFVIVLGVLIFFHELGHFLVAKLFDVKVLKFSLGFGPKLVGRKFGETQYLISAVPLGGYVKMLGENGEDDPPLPPEEAHRSFSNKPVLQRIAIVAAGPAFNLLLALILFCGSYMADGSHVMLPEVGQVREGSPADKAGIQKGDIIAAINGQAIRGWSEIKDMIQAGVGRPVQMVLQRGEKRIDLTVHPEMSVTRNLFGEEIQTPLIGVVASGEMKQIRLGVVASVAEGFKRTGEIIYLTILTIIKLIQRVIPIDTLGGPILIGQMTGQIAQENVSYLVPFMAVISINLAVLNLLPIPVLDGGLIIFLLIELILGKPLSLNKWAVAQKVGLYLLILLMGFVVYNDVMRLLE